MTLDLTADSILPLEHERATRDFRLEVREFLRANLPKNWVSVGQLADDEREKWVLDWRERLVANKMICVAWPSEFGGGGLSPAHHVVLLEEFTHAGAPTNLIVDTLAMNLLGPTILALGTDQQKRRFLPRMISGEDRWCQGYSEPGSGSDLASVQVHATLRDGAWIISGQKTWTSWAQAANWMFALVRTDRAAKKHVGLSFLLIPMHQPGIEVRPIVDLNGHHHLNEVFLTDAVTDECNVLGDVGGGWKVANALLGYERSDGSVRDTLNLRDEFSRVLKVAKERGATRDPLIRSRLAQAYVDIEAIRHTAMRGVTAALRGISPGPESSIHKLLWSEYHQRITTLALEIIGDDILSPSGRRSATDVNTDVSHAPFSSRSWSDTYYAARADTIYAGTSEIQRNIIAERVLQLPRDPRPA